MDKKSMLMIVNPTAGRQEMRDYFLEAVDRFVKAGFSVTVHTTQSKRDAYQVVMDRGEQFDILVCSGGDGTLSETINGLMGLSKKPVLGYIPAGTTNDFASSLDLSLHLPSAVGTILGGHTQAIDIGSFCGLYFAYVAAFGIFTDVAYSTPQDMKNTLGHLAYILEGIKRLANIQPCSCVIDNDGDILKGDFIYGMVANAMSIGGFKMLTGKNICLDDGLLEVILVRMPQSLMQLQDIIAALLSGDLHSDLIVSCKTKCISIRSKTEIAWTLDGEYGGSAKEVDILCHPRAVRILTDPPGALSRTD